MTRAQLKIAVYVDGQESSEIVMKLNPDNFKGEKHRAERHLNHLLHGTYTQVFGKETAEEANEDSSIS